MRQSHAEVDSPLVEDVSSGNTLTPVEEDCTWPSVVEMEEELSSGNTDTLFVLTEIGTVMVRVKVR